MLIVDYLFQYLYYYYYLYIKHHLNPQIVKLIYYNQNPSRHWSDCWLYVCVCMRMYFTYMFVLYVSVCICMYDLYGKIWYKNIIFTKYVQPQWLRGTWSQMYICRRVFRVPKRSMVFLLKGQCAFGAHFSAQGARTKRKHIFLLSHLPEIHTCTYVQILRNTCTYIYIMIHVDTV